MLCSRYRHDPGPCPVDDAPHTTCVAPTAVTVRTLGSTTQSVTVPLQRPGWLRAPVTAPAPAQQIVETFTTATYRRSSFGKGSRSRRR